MTHPNPKDPQAELEDKVKDELIEYFYWDGGGNERTIDEATDKLLALFQAHQLELLSDRAIFKLLHKYADEIIEDHDNWSGRDNVPMITGRYAMKIKDAVNAELQNKTNDGGKNV